MVIVFLAYLLVFEGSLLAGGGPENLVLVVNANSQASLEVANHYAKIYNLPSSNVIHLDYQGDKEEVKGSEFRQQILLPVFKAINDRSLAAQIDLITYSCDFPWRVRLNDLFPEGQKFSKQQKPWASLNGATYLWQSIIKPSTAVVSMHSNWYVPGLNHQNISRCKSLGQVQSRGFRSRYYWKPDGTMTTKQNEGRRYFLSTMLGVVTGRGNSVDEVLASLQRSAYANSLAPKGTFYFMRRDEVRSTTRHDCFQDVVKQINAMGGNAKIEDGVFPKSKEPILGLMIGRSDLPLDRIRPNIQPGAICEHLTSLGGMLHDKKWQTPLTDLIRAGASGASGTVVEPYAIQAKFPLPSMHLHYRRGCNLAESFYQSVAAPYQLLIVGDPLCQPWANRPRIEVTGWIPGGELQVLTREVSKSIPAKNQVETADMTEKAVTTEQGGAKSQYVLLQTHAEQLANSRPTMCEFYLDGRLKLRMPAGGLANLKIDSIPNGWHEARCVVANNDSIESRGSISGWFVKTSPDDGSEKTDLISLKPASFKCRYGEPISLTIEADGASQVVVKAYSQEVGNHDGGKGELLIDSNKVGRGPVRLQAYSKATGAASAPVWITVQ